jgi:hypothetical protein
MRTEARGRRLAGGLFLGALLLAPAAGFPQTLVVVRDEGGAPVGGAEVYQNCTRRGLTNGSGLLVLSSAAAGDHLQVRKTVETGASFKGAHDGWSYHAWRTNISMENDGRQVDFTVADPAAAQTIVIRRQNTQIGWNLVGSLEYNASAANLDEISRAMQSASRYLFDVTDGQFFIEQATLYEERERWADADLQFFANMWPNATGSVGAAAVLAGSRHHMYLPGPGFTGIEGDPYPPGTWPMASGFRTIVHEHGHYGLGLWDEYWRTGGSARCTLDRDSVAEARRASIMDNHYNSTELCHDGNHNPATAHGEITGRSTWASLAANWAGAAWTLRTPMSRGDVNPGPDDLSCFARMTPTVVAAPEPSCASLDLRARTTAGLPIANVGVDLHHRGRTIFQGNTDRAGRAPIYGGAEGDLVTLRPGALRSRQICLWWDGEATVTSSCGRLDIASDLRCLITPFDRPFTVLRFRHEGDPAPDVFLRIPVDDPSLVLKLVLEQDGLRRQEVPLAYDQKQKALTGTFAVDPERALEFALEFSAPGPEGRPMETAARLRGARFDPQAVAAAPGSAWRLMSQDADVNLEVDSQTLPAGTGVLVSETLFPQAAPEGLAAASAVVTVAGEEPLLKAAALSLRYEGKLVQGDTVEIRRLDGDEWIALATTVDVETHRATAYVDTWGTFAVIGKRP